MLWQHLASLTEGGRLRNEIIITSSRISPRLIPNPANKTLKASPMPFPDEILALCYLPRISVCAVNSPPP